MERMVKFLPNRVWRVYRGGAELERWRGAEKPEDGAFPEEWIASTVEARNPQHPQPGEGVSRIVRKDGSVERFDRFLDREGESFLGADLARRTGNRPGFLTKLLDSAIRLPVQAHPDREASRRLFHSGFGKTEAWVVLAGRRIEGVEPYLLIGFRDRFDPAVFRREALEGRMEKTLSMMHRFPVVPGETILIPGGLPHAIGPGVLVQEIMEPTDWVVQPESFCGECPLTLSDRFCGLDAESALGVFHCRTFSEEELRRKIVLPPRILEKTPDALLLERIDRKTIRFFGSLELQLHGSWRCPEEFSCFMAGTVLEGAASAESGTESMAVSRGDTFALGEGCRPLWRGNARILFALPPL